MNNEEKIIFERYLAGKTISEDVNDQYAPEEAPEDDQLGQMEESNVWIKPTALQKYIDERYLDMKYDMSLYKRGIDTDEVYPWDKI